MTHSGRYGGTECPPGFSQPQELLLRVPPSPHLCAGFSRECLRRKKGAFMLGTLGRGAPSWSGPHASYRDHAGGKPLLRPLSASRLRAETAAAAKDHTQRDSFAKAANIKQRKNFQKTFKTPIPSLPLACTGMCTCVRPPTHTHITPGTKNTACQSPAPDG